MEIDVKNLLMQYSTYFSPTGSRVICNPPPLDTDEDWIVYSERFYELYKSLIDINFDIGGSLYSCLYKIGDSFISLERNELNIIITSNEDFYIKFVKATTKAKELNLLNKQDRIDLFQEILYGNITIKQ